MKVSVITPPGEVVSLDEAKKHLRVDFDEDDDYISGLVAAALAWLNGPEGWLGRALGVQTLEMVTDGFADGCRAWIDLPYPPLIDIVSVKYINSAGVETTLDPGAYETALGQLRPTDGNAWPSPRCQSDAVRIRYRAGGKFNTEDPPVLVDVLPKHARIAVLMLVGQWYQTREPIVLGETVEKLPFAVEALLSTCRVFR